LSSDKDWSVGTTALYSCEEGFHITGQSEIVCGEKNGEVDWSGQLPECRKFGKKIQLILSLNLFLNIYFQRKICHNVKVIVNCLFVCLFVFILS